MADDPVIAGIWRYLLQADGRRVLELPDLEDGQSTDDLDVSEPERALIGFWLNPASAQPCKTAGKWARVNPGKWGPPQERSQLYWGPRVRARVARQLEYVRHWAIIEGDYSEAPDIEATWFIDPPYSTPAGRHYRCHHVDFEELGRWARDRRGRVIVCEQEGADWLPFELLGTFATAPGAGKRPKTSREVVWTNFERSQQMTIGF